MTASSSHSANVRGTGKPVIPSAVMTRYSRSTACADGRSLPGGLRRSTYSRPPGKLLPSAHAVDREYRVITALAGTGVPVPRTYVLCEDPGVIGTVFFVMECVHGRLFTQPWLADIAPAER